MRLPRRSRIRTPREGGLCLGGAFIECRQKGTVWVNRLGRAEISNNEAVHLQNAGTAALGRSNKWNAFLPKLNR